MAVSKRQERHSRHDGHGAGEAGAGESHCRKEDVRKDVHAWGWVQGSELDCWG